MGSSALLIALVLFIRFSPYKKLSDREQNGIQTRIIIDRQVNVVFDFMFESQNTKNGTLYVDHINVITKQTDSASEIGTISRFYCNNDETGQTYDGEVLKSVKNIKRVVKLSNFIDFPIEFNEVINEQLFKPISENKCELRLSLYYKNSLPDFWDEIKAHVASYRIKMAIYENMQKIKNELENPMPYAKF